jgi:hypothetical protein
MIVALDTSAYAGGANCGRSVRLAAASAPPSAHRAPQITVTNTNTGKSATGKVADSCPSCGGACPRFNSFRPRSFPFLGYGNVDLSKAFFDAISGGADGALLPSATR